MEIKIVRRHSGDCPDKADRYAPRCGCPLWGEFNWPQPPITFNRKKLRHGQNRRSLNARTKAEALRHAANLENDLEALLQGKPLHQNSITVEAAVQKWLRWTKPSTGETVYNLLVCEADRNDCKGLNVGQEYTLFSLLFRRLDLFGGRHTFRARATSRKHRKREEQQEPPT